MKASEIMTRDVVTVRLETPVQNVAKLMINHRISGIPVIEDSGLVGIISENDLLRRVELGTEKARPRWLQLFLVISIILDIIGSSVAGYFLESPVIMAGQALALIGWLMQIIGDAADRCGEIDNVED